MGTERKTRVYATISGIDTQLFSVLENSDGSLTLNETLPLNSVDHSNNVVPFKREHYSVHRSNDGNDTTITQTTSFLNGQVRSLAAFLPNTSERLCWPIWMIRLHRLQAPKKFRRRSKDELIKICEFDQNKNLMLYSLIVSNSDFVIPAERHPWFNYAEIIVGKYKLIVVFTYLHYPALDEAIRRMSALHKEPVV